MTFELNIPATVAIVFFVIACGMIMWEKPFLACISMIFTVVSGITYCEGRPEAVAERKADAEAARRAAIPHVIREADGCKVYQFRANGLEHYFTRCPDSVTTDRHYQTNEKCGKNCTKTIDHVETIVTKEQP